MDLEVPPRRSKSRMAAGRIGHLADPGWEPIGEGE
jgi:hypothetical protein